MYNRVAELEEGLEAVHEHGVTGRSLSMVDAYNPEAARASYVNAVKALEDASFPLVDLLKSKKDVGMDEVLDCFLLDGPLAGLPEAAYLQPCIEQLSVPIHHAGDKTAFGETSSSFALMNVWNENSFIYDSSPNSFDNPPDFSYPPPQPQTYSCELCGNDAHYGYDCPPQVPFVYNQDPCFNQNYDNFPQTSPSFQQQYICCTRCGGPHETCQCDQLIFDEPYCANCGGPHMTFQCQPMNYYEPNPCYDSNYSGFDQIEPPQFPVIHQPPQEMSIQDMEDLKQQYLDEMKTLINEKDYRSGRIDIEIKINELKENFNEMSIEINKKKKLQQLEQVANLSTYPSRHFNSFCYDDDDDEEYTIAITPEKPVDSLIMEDEHLDTIPETESDEFIKSSVENLVPTPSESEDFSDIESECDVPDCDDSQTTNFSTFFNPLFDDSTSSDDESRHEEVIDVLCNTPKMGRSGIRIRGMLLQDQ
ncbi:hypothetical protein Tco_0958577, partial [Tanacetum coccineum]